MKLFQIEEPDGGPADPSASGAAIGIDASGPLVEVAISVGGNALILSDREGFERVLPVPGSLAGTAEWQEVLEAARMRVAPRREPRAAGRRGPGAGRRHPRRRLGPAAGLMPKMIFVERDGTRREVDAPLGDSVLEIARRHDIDIEGACEGSLACSTCHVIVDPEWYELLNDASEDEEDMLDLAFNLTKTSRLGCQIVITEELDGLTVRLPAATRNLLLG